jgi:hypothetical protein
MNGYERLSTEDVDRMRKGHGLPERFHGGTIIIEGEQVYFSPSKLNSKEHHTDYRHAAIIVATRPNPVTNELPPCLILGAEKPIDMTAYAKVSLPPSIAEGGNSFLP